MQASPPVTAPIAIPGQPRSPLATVQHTYGTRIRQNSVIRPSARLRQSPDPPAHPAPRRLKPTPTPQPKLSSAEPHPPANPSLPVFPPSNVMLHPDDATNKVFLAIGRSFLSVENRAMTIKDLAEMSLNHGLLCHNVSAAGQAITTYVRNHIIRCEAEDDQPLLLKHVLSGTPADDDLIPALHSRSGGAHCGMTSTEPKITSFRRGTTVWYLSRAAGVPCPFARAGIRLRDYDENGRVSNRPDHGREMKRDRDRLRRAEHCGQKRKRLPRSCVDRDAESESPAEEEKRPPKVKLTLRLKPRMLSSSSSPPICTEPNRTQPREVIDLSNDLDSDVDSENSLTFDGQATNPTHDASEDIPWTLALYPMRSPFIPAYTPSLDGHYPSFPALSSSHNTTRVSSITYPSPSPMDGSPTPPPESDEEEDDFPAAAPSPMTDDSLVSSAEEDAYDDDEDMEWDFDDFDGETESQCGESPGPRSPSAQYLEPREGDVVVKQELTGVRGMLDAWEDVDNGIAASDARVIEVVAQAAAGLDGATSKVKLEEHEMWQWETYGSASPPAISEQDDALHIKEEDIEDENSRLVGGSSEPLAQPLDDEDDPMSPLFTLSPISPTSLDAAIELSPLIIGPRRASELTWKDVELLGPDSVQPQEFEEDDEDDGTPRKLHKSGTIRARSNTAPLLPAFDKSTARQLRNFTFAPFPARQPFFLPPPTHAGYSLSAETPSTPSISSPELSAPLQSWSSPESRRDSIRRLSPPSQSTSPLPRRERDIHVGIGSDEPLLVHTCQPCTPPISATQVEGIPVYQMTLGSSALYRRIDTDFVNMSPILAFSNISLSSATVIESAVHISTGSPVIRGIWAPLSSAQSYVRQHPLPNGLLDVFLSDFLYERFPSALHDFHHSIAKGRILKQFGPHFQSTIDAQPQSPPHLIPHREVDTPWERGMVSHWDVEDHLLSVQPPLALVTSGRHTPPPECEVRETPLSPTEQEIFHALCGLPDWESQSTAIGVHADEVSDDSSMGHSGRTELPLRRSKRVANAIASRSARPTRSPKKRTAL